GRRVRTSTWSNDARCRRSGISRSFASARKTRRSPARPPAEGQTPQLGKSKMASFLEELREQRWDDHRYYHHSRINQSLHLVSAISFLTSYALMTVSPSIAAILGWFVAMWSRQIGHFFFEPKGFDEING